LTAQRRARSLVGRGLVFADVRRFFEITEAGRQTLGPVAAPTRWLRHEAISAAMSREVLARRRGEVDDAAQVISLGRPRGGKWDGGVLREERLRA
jgi:hypothetical protein